MLPLHLHKLHLFVTKNLSFPIQNQNGPLNLVQTLIHLNVVQRNNCGLVSDTLLKLRHMEGVVNLAKLVWQDQTVSHLAHLGKNPTRINKLRP